MVPSVEAILALTGASSVLGVIALAAYLYLLQKIRALDVTQPEKQRFMQIRRITLGAAPFFFLTGFASLTYGGYSNPEIATAITNFIHRKALGADPTPTPKPQHLGHVTITPKIKTIVREISTHPAVMVRGKGKNSTYPAHFNIVPDLASRGWKIDIGVLVATHDWWQQDAGEGGSSCIGLDRSSASGNGFTFLIQLGRNKDVFHEWDAVQYCNLARVPLVRDVERQVDGVPIERDLVWSSDVLVPLPQNTISYVMLLAVDGFPERILTDNSTSPFDFLGIKKEDNKILFQLKGTSAMPSKT
jgi:hypothetical protein